MNAKVERWSPLIIGFFTATIYFCFLQNYSLPSSVRDLFSSAMQVSSITIGFLATALSVLLSIESKNIIQQLKNAGVYKKLVNYFVIAVNWSFALVIFSAICLLLDFKVQWIWNSVTFAAWLFALTGTAASCYRVIDIFASILRSSN